MVATMGGFGKRAWRKQKRILSKVRGMKGGRNTKEISTASKPQQRENVERLEDIADDLLRPEYVSHEEQRENGGVAEVDYDSTDNSANEHRRDINRRWR